MLTYWHRHLFLCGALYRGRHSYQNQDVTQSNPALSGYCFYSKGYQEILEGKATSYLHKMLLKKVHNDLEVVLLVDVCVLVVAGVQGVAQHVRQLVLLPADPRCQLTAHSTRQRDRVWE